MIQDLIRNDKVTALYKRLGVVPGALTPEEFVAALFENGAPLMGRYRKTTDDISLNPINTKNPGLVALHELIHWTGHPDRLGRFSASKEDLAKQSQDEVNYNYWREECITAMVTAVLAPFVDIPERDSLDELLSIQPTQEYLAKPTEEQGAIRDSMALEAQRVADYLLPHIIALAKK